VWVSPSTWGIFTVIDVVVQPGSKRTGLEGGFIGTETMVPPSSLSAEYVPSPRMFSARTLATISSPSYKLKGEMVRLFKLTSQYKLVKTSAEEPSHSASSE
jgi:hypothetical protein